MADSQLNNGRIAHSTSKYGFVFGRRGLVMESCSSYFLPRLIGQSRAMYLASTGGVYPPTAPAFGPLFIETYPEKDRVVSRALELATDIAKNVSPLSGRLNRALLWRGPESPEEAHLLESRVLFHMFRGKDQKEGVGSFLEKRQADFNADVFEDAPPGVPWWTEVDIERKVKRTKL